MGIFILNIPWILYYIYSGLYLTAINASIQTMLIGIAYLTLLRISKMDRIFLSFNSQFFKVKPKELINLVKKYDKLKLIYGFEITTTSKEEEAYVKELAKIANKKCYKINLHSLPLKNEKSIKEYLDFAVELAKITNDKINIVYHPEETFEYKNSIEETRKTIEQLFKCIRENKYSKYIDISIENLNNMGDMVRLKKEDLIQFLDEEENLKFTFDIGHEIVDNIETTELPEILSKRLNNIHIHTHKGSTDHYPIENLNNEKTIKELLIKYSKKQNIVMEYAINYIEGKSFEEKLENYINYANTIYKNRTK